ncbi:hypothetical protein CIB48_g10018 [Xylaria polymorpha]|nr:hypothetical protein CIB48_g10018 [Xylaria polymorpha]
MIPELSFSGIALFRAALVSSDHKGPATLKPEQEMDWYTYRGTGSDPKAPVPGPTDPIHLTREAPDHPRQLYEDDEADCEVGN